MKYYAFDVDDRVEALHAVQGMKKGERFTVKKVDARFTPFGTFVEYTIENAEHELVIGNGHMVLGSIVRGEHCTHPDQQWCDCDWCRFIRPQWNPRLNPKPKMEYAITTWHGESGTAFYVTEHPEGQPDNWTTILSATTREEAEELVRKLKGGRS